MFEADCTAFHVDVLLDQNPGQCPTVQYIFTPISSQTPQLFLPLKYFHWAMVQQFEYAFNNHSIKNVHILFTVSSN